MGDNLTTIKHLPQNQPIVMIRNDKSSIIKVSDLTLHGVRKEDKYYLLGPMLRVSSSVNATLIKED